MNTKENIKTIVDWPMVGDAKITTQALKDAGFSVITNSFRNVSMPYIIDGQDVMVPVPIPTYEIRRKDLQGAIQAKGGYMTVKVSKVKPNGESVTVVGESICHPSEHFCKDVGVKLATADAVSKLKSVGMF